MSRPLAAGSALLSTAQQIFVVNDPLAGALMLCGIGYYSVGSVLRDN